LIKGKNYSEKTKRILRRFFDRPFNVDESNPSSVTTINKTLLSYSGKRDVLVRGSLRTERKAGLDYLFATGTENVFSMTCNFFSKTKFQLIDRFATHIFSLIAFLDCFNPREVEHQEHQHEELSASLEPSKTERN